MSDHLNRRITKLEEKVSHLESLNAPQQQDITGAGPQDASRTEDNAAGRQMFLASNIPPTPANPNKPKQPWYKTIQGWKAVLEIVAIPFGIAYAIVTGLQWHDLRHHFEIEQRSWMRPMIQYPKDQNVAAVNLHILNVGKSVALGGIGEVWLEIVDSSKAPSLKLEGKHFRSTVSTVFPGDFTDVPFSLDGRNPPKFTETEMQSLSTGKSYFAAFGQIVYEDQFGPHWTRFCTWRNDYVKDPDIKFRAFACVAFNAVGDGPIPR